ncbi:MAG: NAD-dependent dehydratase [Chloroflexi bacterium]|nr:NAD-dependent dehydratase [Chloroflexota bacterium]
MRILIIGGTNFIGPRVVAELTAGGHKVAVFHRGETEHADTPGITHIHGDRERIAAFGAEFRQFAPEVVLDMACMFERDARAAVDVMRGIARRAVVVSSVDVYRVYGRMHGSEPGPVEALPLTEDSPLREKLYPYRGERGDGRMDGYDKIPVERAYMSEPELPGTVIRLPAVHGEGDYQRRLFMEVRRFEAGRPYILVQDDAAGWRWARAYVGNVARAIALVATDERASGRVYNAPVDPGLTQREWLAANARIAGWRGEIVELPAEMMPAHLRQPVNFGQSMAVDDSRIRGELGYADAVPPEEGMRRAIEWERAQPAGKSSAKYLDFEAEDAAISAVRALQGS